MTGPQPILPISRPNEQQDDADFSLETETLVGTDHSPENRPSLGITGPVSAILDPNFCLLTVSEFVVIVTLVVYSSIHSSPQYPDLSEWAACNMPLGVLNSLWLVNMTYVPLAVVWVLRYLFPTKESKHLHILYALDSTWYIVALFFVSLSFDSCRLAAPHLWWLTVVILFLHVCLPLTTYLLVWFVVRPILVLVVDFFDREDLMPSKETLREISIYFFKKDEELKNTAERLVVKEEAFVHEK